ncbi:hypothetical protein Pla123a_07510 [Posidoniimonas polymericola]|uniref:PEP-CTERM protein-sorting domain-containing protein n=1 Tax=Posidoniimonas polymericola TaxID=2528002 RepID=A0A5C5ZEZ6_9BACT|nr:PEP-CTERM sorting domain-containing protein [Posidoniimonas polymericola]TWT85944.1 hypothetical protein Pla123a_07510 [Posidoniimonas polymericola]
MTTCNRISSLLLAQLLRKQLVVAAALLVTAAGSAFAGTLATTSLAYNDGAGPDGGIWRGSVTVSATSFTNDEVDAVVDFAVFPPGPRFQQYLDDNGYAGVDPSNGDAVYAYQISSVSAAVPGIGSLSVGIDASDIVSLITSVATGVAGEVSPTADSNQGGTSAFWSFGNPVGVGGLSSILVITSPTVPAYDTLQLTSGIAGPNPSPLVPSPTDSLEPFREVPEPVSIGLLMSVALCGVSLRCKR